MSEHFYEIEPGDEGYDTLLPLLPPQVFDLGQLIWWNRTPGIIVEARIRRIEVGYYSSRKAENAARRYVAEAHRQTQHDYQSTSVKWRDYKNSGPDGWASGYGFLTDPSYVYPLRSTFEKAREEAAKDMDRWANDAVRDAERRRLLAIALRAVERQEEPA